MNAFRQPLNRKGESDVYSLTQWQAEEERVLEHLKYIGYTTDDEPDPHGWRFATNPHAPLLGFRAGPHFVCLHAEYPAGHYALSGYHDLLREVNHFNAVHWLVRSTVLKRRNGAGLRLAVRLQANVPMRLPAEELGACLLTWIRESTAIERATRMRMWVATETCADDASLSDTSDDHPTQTT
jgi:hypothetical protein